MPEDIKLLVICLGNICRSPMGEGALRAHIAASPLAGKVTVDSAGISSWHSGQAPDPRAVACAQRHGVDISSLRARPLYRVDFRQFSHIFCADNDNFVAAKAKAPANSRAQIALWLPWAGIEHTSFIPDPYYGNEADFERAWALVDAAAQATVQRLLNAN